jgi:hypothetical protein
MGTKLLTGLALALILSGCFQNGKSDKSRKNASQRTTRSGNGTNGTGPGNVTITPIGNFSTADYQLSSAAAAKILLNRIPNYESEVAAAGESREAYELTVRSMVFDAANEERLKLALMDEHRRYFKLGGSNPASDIDYDQPARLGTYLVVGDRDYREILTAKYCVNPTTFQQEPCDTFRDSPTSAQQHAAGVLSSRAFIAAHKKGAGFNFRLVRESFKTFACAAYPDTADSGTPAAEVSSTKHPWGIKDGRPTECYVCHRSMNPKAFPFYYFSPNGLFTTQVGTTTLTDATTPSAPEDVIVPGATPRVMGRPTRTLTELAEVFVSDRRFSRCMVQRYTNFLMARPYESQLPAELEYLVDQFEQGGYKVKTLLTQILESNVFLARGR